MRLSVSDAVRMLLAQVVAEQALPFDVRAPHVETAAAIQELEAGRGQRFESVETLLADAGQER
jgi:DNA-damage-inducible protein J